MILAAPGGLRSTPPPPPLDQFNKNILSISPCLYAMSTFVGLKEEDNSLNPIRRNVRDRFRNGS